MVFSQHSLFFFITIAVILSPPCRFITPALSQQPYIREYGTDCSDQPKDTSALGYLCGGGGAATCPAFLSFRARKPYDTVAAIAAHLSADAAGLARANSVAPNATFGANALVFVPVDCSCRGGGGDFYQYDASYVADADDNYFEIANVTFQGLTTCQAIANQTGNPPTLNLQTGDKVIIPLRCACPSKNQTDIGMKYLLSYITDVDDDDSKMSDEFGIDNALFLKANRLSDLDNTIYPDTTVLIPLRSWPPNATQAVQEPPPSPPSPRAIPSPPLRSSSKTRVYVLAGALGGCLGLLILSISFIFFLFKTRKGKSKKDDDLVLASKSLRAQEKENSYEDVLKQVIITSDVAGSLKVYDIEELKLATNNFGPACLIDGSVYRGTIDGHSMAIKKMDGDVSKEINLLQKINHFNVVRLTGICLADGQWYVVYDYASNGSLNDWLFKIDDNNKILTWTQRIQIALNVATGLNYLHSFANPPQVHKDIKCSNILLDSDYRAKIANFGSARSTRAHQEGEFSVTNHIVGTIGYLPPEYLESGLVSTKLDVYAFGVVLLEMITGKEVSELYEENKNLTNLLSGLISDHNEGEAKGRLRGFLDVSLGETYPDQRLVVFVVRIIDGCLKKNPEVRPTMDEIVQILSKALSLSIIWEISIGLVGMSKLYSDSDSKN